jgi:hypothetical protein
MTKAYHVIMLGQYLVTKKPCHIFLAKERSHKKQKKQKERKCITNLHQMALIGLHVTQYMYVLFDKVHIYIQKSLFTFARYVLPAKHPVESADVNLQKYSS